MFNAIRFVGNIVLGAAWLFVFNALGWITFHPVSNGALEWWQALLVIALITKVIEYVFDFLYMTFVMVTCGIGCITLPVVMFLQGWLFLLGAAKLTGWFTVNVTFFWIGLLMSIAYGMIRIPAATKITTTTTSPSTTFSN